MARRLVASVLSLFLVGLAGKASAEPEPEPEPEAKAPAGVVALFGKTLCLPAAPADAACTWRIGAPDRPANVADSAPPSLSLFGMRWCLASGTLGDCDAAPEPLEIFGVRIPAFEPTNQGVDREESVARRR